MNKFLTERELNTIRGKVLAGHATRDEMLSVFTHLDQIEMVLDDDCDPTDCLGTDGWREFMGIK